MGEAVLSRLPCFVHPSSVVTQAPSSDSLILELWGLLEPENAFSYTIKKGVPRFQAERTFAWFQKKYRRLVVRWERQVACFEAFLAIATIHIWIQRLLDPATNSGIGSCQI